MNRALLIGAVLFVIAGPAAAANPFPPPAPPACELINAVCATIDLPAVGTGSGRIVSVPAGIDCTVTLGAFTGACSHTFIYPLPASPSVAVELTWTPAVGSLVGDFGTAVSHAVERVDLKVTSDNPHRTFDFLRFGISTIGFEAAVQGLGSGEIVGALGAGQTSCNRVSCHGTANYGSTVTLTAKAAAGSVFEGWTNGVCAGQSATCSFTLTTPVVAAAVFGRAPVATPPAPVPGPSPSPTPSPPPAAPAPAVVLDADLLAAKTAQSKLGARLVLAELQLGETVAGTVTLTRGVKTIVTKPVSGWSAGTRVVTVVVPKSVRRGPVTVTVALHNAAGATVSWSRALVLPKQGK